MPALRGLASEISADAPQSHGPGQHLGQAGAEHADLAAPVEIVGRCRARRMRKKGGADRQIAKYCGDQNVHGTTTGFGELNSGYSVAARLAIPKSPQAMFP